MSEPRNHALQFTVHGVPAPQGSKSFKGFAKNGHAILAESSTMVKPWRQDVVAAAYEAKREHGSWRPIAGAVHVVVEFFLWRPKSQPKTRRTLPTTAPDLDKLIRATHDALTTAGVYTDDALVTDLTIRKRYIVQDDTLGHPWELPGPGAVITIFEVDPDDSWADSPLDMLVAKRFPVPELPATILELAGYTPQLDADQMLGETLVIAAEESDSKAMQAVRRALTLISKRQGLGETAIPAQVPFTLVLESGMSRLASVAGKPLTRLQEGVAEVAYAGIGLGVAVLLTDRQSYMPDVNQGASVANMRV